MNITSLEHLSLRSMSITEDKAVRIFQALPGAGQVGLKSLNFGGNLLGDCCVSYLIECLAESSGLNGLYLRDCGVGLKSLSSLCLLSNRFYSLTYLSLQGNKLRDESMNWFKGFLRDNRLEKLDLSENELTDEGMFLFCDMIAENSQSLRSVNFAGNKMSSIGLYRILEYSCLHCSSRIAVINLQRNCIDWIDVDFVSSMFERNKNKNFVSVDLRNNSLNLNLYTEWPNRILLYPQRKF
jgi:Ran GTPase-activating protein (RanGAP) involved in mRNA processing and transport